MKNEFLKHKQEDALFSTFPKKIKALQWHSYEVKNPENNISELSDFRKRNPYSSGDHFSESCAPRKMMQDRIDEIF